MRLRTLLLLVVVLAIPCAWVGSEAKLVGNRRTMLDRVRAGGGVVSWEHKITWMPAISIKPANNVAPISAIRQYFGDRWVKQISVPRGFPAPAEKQILDLFPESEVVKFWPPAGADPVPR
jgi:hypothetical protein